MHWHRYTNEHSKTQGNTVPDRYTAAKALQNSVKLHLTVWRVQLYPVLWKPSTTCGHYLYTDHHNYDEQERLTSVLPFSFLIQLLLEFCATAQLNALGPVYKQQLKIHTLLSAVNITFFYHEKLKCPCDKKNRFLFSSDFESVFAWHLRAEISSSDFYPKTAQFKCKFWILRSTITCV